MQHICGSHVELLIAVAEVTINFFLYVTEQSEIISTYVTNRVSQSACVKFALGSRHSWSIVVFIVLSIA